MHHRIMLLMLLFLGCDSRPTHSDKSTTLSPVQVTERLNSLFKDRKYVELSLLITEKQRSSMIGFLKAVDKVLAANERLRIAANKRYGSYLKEVWAIVELGNILGPFSSNMRIIDQEAGTDGRMFVILQEGENVPLYKAQFVQLGGRWLYRPEPVPNGMIDEVEALAQKLEETASCVANGAGFEYYMNSILTEVYPQMQQIVSLPDETTIVIHDDNFEP